MAKFIQNLAIAIIFSVAICNASPARLEKVKPSKLRFLSRQEVAENVPEQTPYPPAGIKPEVRFDLPTDEKLVAPDNTYLPPVGAPAQTYGPPANTYGPPEVSVKDEVEEVADDKPVVEQTETPQPEEPQSEGEPQSNKVPVANGDEPSEQSQEDTVAEDDAATEAEQIEAEIERVEAEEGLISPFPARIVLARNNGKKSAKLQVATPLRRQSLVAEPIYLVNYNGQLYRLLN